MRKNLEKEDISWDPETENFISVNGTAQVNKYCKIETHTPSTKLILKGPFYPFHYLSKDCSDLMLHTKWNSIDKYSYSSHVTYTGALSILVIPIKTCNTQIIRQTLLDFGYCCRIYPILELEEPAMLQHSKWSGQWLRPEFSEALFFPFIGPRPCSVKFCQTLVILVGFRINVVR